jgi:hypothetical protein
LPIRVGDADPAPRIISIPAATRLASIAAHIAISRSRIAFIASLRVAINASRISSSKISATTTIESAARAVDNTATNPNPLTATNRVACAGARACAIGTVGIGAPAPHAPPRTPSNAPRMTFRPPSRVAPSAPIPSTPRVVLVPVPRARSSRAARAEARHRARAARPARPPARRRVVASSPRATRSADFADRAIARSRFVDDPRARFDARDRTSRFRGRSTRAPTDGDRAIEVRRRPSREVRRARSNLAISGSIDARADRAIAPTARQNTARVDDRHAARARETRGARRRREATRGDDDDARARGEATTTRAREATRETFVGLANDRSRGARDDGDARRRRATATRGRGRGLTETRCGFGG